MSTTTLAPPIRVDTAGVHTRPGLGRLVAVELRKMVDTRAGFWMQVATVALTVVAVIVRSVAGDAADHTFASVLDARRVQPAAVLLPVVGILLVTSEWSQRTGMITFALVPVRSRVVGAKLLASHRPLASRRSPWSSPSSPPACSSPRRTADLGRRRDADRPDRRLPDGRDAHGRRVRHGPARLGARHRRAVRAADRVDARSPRCPSSPTPPRGWTRASPSARCPRRSWTRPSGRRPPPRSRSGCCSRS